MSPQKNFGLALAQFNSMQSEWRKSVITFVSEKFSEMGPGIKKGTELWYQSLMEVKVYFDEEIQSNIYCK